MFVQKFAVFTVLCLSIVFAGCVGSKDDFRELDENDNVTNTSPPEAHGHHHDEGPHGGHILEFGDYHGEITFNDGIVTVYTLGDDAETAVALEGASAVLKLIVGEEAQEIALAANPQEGEAEGTSSRFASAAGAVPESIKDIEGILGSVVITKGEDTLTAKIEHDHDHEGHDH